MGMGVGACVRVAVCECWGSGVVVVVLPPPDRCLGRTCTALLSCSRASRPSHKARGILGFGALAAREAVGWLVSQLASSW